MYFRIQLTYLNTPVKVLLERTTEKPHFRHGKSIHNVKIRGNRPTSVQCCFLEKNTQESLVSKNTWSSSARAEYLSDSDGSGGRSWTEVWRVAAGTICGRWGIGANWADAKTNYRNKTKNTPFSLISFKKNLQHRYRAWKFKYTKISVENHDIVFCKPVLMIKWLNNGIRPVKQFLSKYTKHSLYNYTVIKIYLYEIY